MITYDRLREIGCVGVWLETFTGVSCVLRGQVRCEVVESAYQISASISRPWCSKSEAHTVVGVANRANLFE